MTILSDLAFLVLVALFVLRARHAIVSPAARVSWLASAAAAAALSVSATFVPYAALDALLGGSNIMNLLQNVFSGLAFFLTAAAVSQVTPRLSRLQWWPMIVVVTAYSIAFFCIPNRHPSSSNFIDEHPYHLATVLYVGIYMGYVAAVSMQMIRGVARRREKVYRTFIVGGALVVIGCVAETLYHWAEWLGWFSIEVRTVLDALFVPFFYIGVMVIAGGITTLTLLRRRRKQRLVSAANDLLRVATAAGVAGTEARATQSDAEDKLAARVYDLAIAIRDEQHVNDLRLEPGQLAQVEAAEQLVAMYVFGTTGPVFTGPQPLPLQE